VDGSSEAIMIIYGINPVLEALKAGRVKALWVSGSANTRLKQLAELAARKGVGLQPRDAQALDRLADGGVHQGVVAELRGSGPLTVQDLVRDAKAAPLIVVLDSIEDPHNVGAILRTADAAGADGIVRQSRHAAPLGGAAAKASAGAVAHVAVAEVVNIARAVEELKEAGVWTIGLAGDGTHRYDEVDLTLPSALVLGAEGTGMRRLVRERCDWLVSIPMLGHVESLNVSVAAGIVLYEAVRQRSPRKNSSGRP
jgi:23S rRNA (guanosine2251-2'-O)-methyltransferase